MCFYKIIPIPRPVKKKKKTVSNYLKEIHQQGNLMKNIATNNTFFSVKLNSSIRAYLRGLFFVAS